MTPEEVEARLRSLRTPAPPARLRERCLSPRRPRAAWTAVAASFLVVALAGWLIAIGRGPSPAPDEVLPPPADPGPFADDPVLRGKVDRLLQANPGKGVLVIRVKRLREGTFIPVTSGFDLKILLEPAEEVPDPLKYPGGPWAEVDLDGTMLFVTTPGRYRGAGYENNPNEELKKLCFVWEYKAVDLKPGQALRLADAVFAPWVQWSTPVEGSEVSLGEDRKIFWAPYPEITSARIVIERVTKAPDGVFAWEGRGELKRDCRKDGAIPLSDLQKVSRAPLLPGETLALWLEGFDRDGRKLAESRDKLTFKLRE
jgi:hypothetical protein